MKKLLLILFLILGFSSIGCAEGSYYGVAAAGDTTPPTLTSSTIPTAGTSISLLFSETVSIGAGGNEGWTIVMTGGAVTMTYSSGSGSNTLVYTLSRTVNSGETGTVAYVQPGNGIEDASGNDLATIVTEAVTNNSTQGSCTTSNDSAIVDMTALAVGDDCGIIGPDYGGPVPYGFQFVTTGTKTITEYVLEINAVASAGSVSCSLYTDSTGSVGILISGTTSPTVSISTTGRKLFTLVTPYTNLTAGTYWMACIGIADPTLVRTYYQSGGSNRIRVGETDYYNSSNIDMAVYGCDQ